eukprot:2385003-Amphidinium_carterae.1
MIAADAPPNNWHKEYLAYVWAMGKTMNDMLGATSHIGCLSKSERRPKGQAQQHVLLYCRSSEFNSNVGDKTEQHGSILMTYVVPGSKLDALLAR